MEAIKVDSISKVWPGLKALDNLIFSVHKGTIHGFLGPNGAGKSTALNIITGLINPTHGKIHLEGTFGFLPEHPPLYGNMVVSAYLGFVARIFGLSSTIIPSRIDETIERCGLGSVRKRLIINLSKGFKQRVALAQAMIHKPDILILDEPTVGLDPNSVMDFRNLILSLKQNHTILFSSHQLSEVDRICDDLTIINRGQLIATGPKEKIKKMFNSKQVLSVELLAWKTELENDLAKFVPFEKLETITRQDTSLLKIFINTKDDVRSQISRFLVEKNCGLISMSEEKLDLEDIFKEVTKEEN